MADLTPAKIVDADSTPAEEIRAQLTVLADQKIGIPSEVGAVNASATGVSVSVSRSGGIATLTFTLDDVAIPFTDAAGSGSSGSIKLFDFAAGDLVPLAYRSALTWAGDTLIDGNQGDLAFIYALGSVAANAGDGALTSTEADFGAVSGTVTLSTFAATSIVRKGEGTAVDGTTADADLFLNVSGTAATAEANGVLTVSGTIVLVCALLGEGANNVD